MNGPAHHDYNHHRLYFLLRMSAILIAVSLKSRRRATTSTFVRQIITGDAMLTALSEGSLRTGDPT